MQGLYTGLDYWLSQHDVGRGGEAWNFYISVLFGVEWPVLLLGLVGWAIAFRRPTLLRSFLVWAFLLSLRATRLANARWWRRSMPTFQRLSAAQVT